MKKLSLLLLLPLLMLQGCSSDTEDTTSGGAAGPVAPAEDTALATMEFIRTGIKEGRPQVLWMAMPESYQNDVNGLVHLFAENMDKGVWDQSMGMVKTIHSILVDKAEFFAGNQMIASNAQAKEAIPMIADLLGTIIDGAGDLDKLKSFDGETFLTTSGTDVMKHMEKLMALNPSQDGSPLASFYGAKFETVESTDTTATLKVIQEDGTEETQNFIKHEGKWLPLDMVEEWDENMQKARESLTALPEQMGPAKMQIGMVTGMVNGVLSPLQSAESQEQFDAALEGLMAQGMGMMGGGMPGMGGGFPGMGGGMAPPPGGPGSLGDGPESLGDAPEGGDNN